MWCELILDYPEPVGLLLGVPSVLPWSHPIVQGLPEARSQTQTPAVCPAEKPIYKPLLTCNWQVRRKQKSLQVFEGGKPPREVVSNEVHVAAPTSLPSEVMAGMPATTLQPWGDLGHSSHGLRREKQKALKECEFSMTGAFIIVLDTWPVPSIERKTKCLILLPSLLHWVPNNSRQQQLVA